MGTGPTYIPKNLHPGLRKRHLEFCPWAKLRGGQPGDDGSLILDHEENAGRSDVATMQGPTVWVDCGEREKEKTVGNLRTPRIQTSLRPALPPPVPVLPEEPVSIPHIGYFEQASVGFLPLQPPKREPSLTFLGS